MERSSFLEMVGFRYIVNHNSKEIHRVGAIKKSCQVKAMTKAGYHIRLSQFYLKSVFGYNGCVHCNKNFDKD